MVMLGLCLLIYITLILFRMSPILVTNIAIRQNQTSFVISQFSHDSKEKCVTNKKIKLQFFSILYDIK